VLKHAPIIERVDLAAELADVYGYDQATIASVLSFVFLAVRYKSSDRASARELEAIARAELNQCG